MASEKRKAQNDKSLHKWIGPAIILSTFVLLMVLLSWASGYLPYTMTAIRCGRQPVIANRFAAAYSYELPGDPYYGYGWFKEYYCTESEAKANGFHHSPLAE